MYKCIGEGYGIVDALLVPSSDIRPGDATKLRLPPPYDDVEAEGLGSPLCRTHNSHNEAFEVCLLSGQEAENSTI